MADFKAAVSLGLSAARKAQANRSEISSVFHELNQEIAQLTEGKVHIARRTGTEYIPGDTVGSLLSFASRVAELTGRQRKYQMIAACHQSSNGPIHEIGRWKEGDDGYPCEITMPGLTINCENRGGLEQGLSRMIATVKAGEALMQVMSYVPKSIDPTERWELNYWATQLGVTEEQIKSAVSAVGQKIDDVKGALGK